MLFKHAAKIGTDHFSCYIYHIPEGEGVGYAMADDDRAVDTQDGGTAVYLEIEMVEERVVKPFLCFKYIVDRLCHFYGHIAYKAFANDHFGLVEENVPALYITYEIDACLLFQQRVSGLAEYVALAFFLTYVQQAHTRPGDTKHMVGV